MAFASSDGILSFIFDDQIVWSKRFEHTLTSLMKLDINQDGEDEIIVSSWDGAVSLSLLLLFLLENSWNQINQFHEKFYGKYPKQNSVKLIQDGDWK